MTARLLAGDIGGSKTVLALYELTETGLRTIREGELGSNAYPSLESAVREFIAGASIARACFAVAGRVAGGTAKLTNVPWLVDTEELAIALDVPEVVVINDLQAAAFGMLFLSPNDFAVISEGQSRTSETSMPEMTIGVIAPGTGLGESLLYWDGARFHAIATEGGHADFAPQTGEEIELLRYLQERFGHVSYERVLSGDGLVSIYSYLRMHGPSEPSWLSKRLAHGDRNAAISEIAINGSDPLCVHAADLFCAVLGAEAGNLALRAGATGGVIIAGGIAPRILPLLQRGPLLERFSRKGRFSAWVGSLALRVSLEPRAPLIGAAHWPLSKECR